MKIDFKKVVKESKQFDIKNNQTVFQGSFKKVLGGFVEVEGRLSGKMNVICDRCAEEFAIELDDDIHIRLYDGEYASDNDDAIEVQECPTGIIDFDEIARNELTMIEMDYHCCEQCYHLDMEDE